jgi:5-methyltetrahydropteroyltriglutamate--homocysteine methyltransferase
VAHVVSTTVLGYPRIGQRRELKQAVESYWSGELDAAGLADAGRSLRRDTWLTLRDAGVDHIPSNTFSFYDHVLDTAVMFSAIPDRFASPYLGQQVDPAGYFALARGSEQIAPLEMTKWFDTNYHYLVPELGPDTRFALSWDKPLAEYAEARELGIETRPVLLGPLSFLLLSKPDAMTPPEFGPLDLLDDLVEAYADLLGRMADAGVDWVQLDEPVLAEDRSAAERDALRHAYDRLGGLAARPKLLVQTYFAEAGDALGVLAACPVEGLGLDFVAGPGNLDAVARLGGLTGKTLVAGVIDGRNVWRADLRQVLKTCATLLGLADELVVSTSCSLLHVPLDVEAESGMDPALRDRLSFARQKLDEVVLLGRALDEGHDAVADELAAMRPSASPEPAGATDNRVRARLESLGQHERRSDHTERAELQRSSSRLPVLPATTIGSFPQTAQIRRTRADHRAGRIDDAEYERRTRAEIDSVIALQEDIGLDVLVHGEPERNDMVQYFAERLSGFATTDYGWVQSYGTRCVRPPILHGDVSRPEPITVGWTTYAQSRTDKPVKGMLTGPVTMLAWSFVRDDQPQADTARQVALALRDEVHDLEAAGVRFIQVDEAALREKLPLRRAEQDDYLAWATAAFRLGTSGVAASTQVHTHMCYSEFGHIIGAIGDLDADVTSVEAARSRMELLTDLGKAGYHRGIGPGVYDIHSPRVPTVDEIEEALHLALAEVDAERLWVNPDCGLKTRGYAEVEPALRNMVEAVRRVRASLPGTE